MICPNCKSSNVTVQLVQDTKLKTKHHNIFWWIFVGSWWVPIKWICFPVIALFAKIFAPKKSKLKQSTHSEAVCQNCGTHWRV